MKMIKRGMALFLCFLMLTSGTISAFATENVSSNDADSNIASYALSTSTLADDESDASSTACEYCGNVSGHAVGCFATFSEVNQEAAFVQYPVTLYYNPGTDLDDCKEYSEADFGEGFVFTVQYAFPGDDGVTWYMLDTENWEIFADTDEPYSYVKSTDVTFDLGVEDTAETTLTDTTSGVVVVGKLPEGTQLVVTGASISSIPGLAVSHLQYKTVSKVGYNISLVDENGEALDDTAFDTVTVYVPGVWNTAYSDPIVDVYHLNSDGTLKEMLTSRNNSVAFCADGGVVIEVSSFSDYWFVSGDTDSNTSVTEGSHTIYIAPGSSGTWKLRKDSDSATLSTTTPVSGVTVSQSSSNNQTTFTITADSSATTGPPGTFTITWTEQQNSGDGRPSQSGSTTVTRTATFTVYVVSESEAIKQEFLGNTVTHVQIDIECEAVILGYNGDEAAAIDLNYSGSNSTNTLTKVEDDSSVGFHYELTYTVDGVETTVILRMDESATKLPDGVSYSDIASMWSVTGTSEESGQISFNGTIPVGTKEYPVVYSVTVESTFDLVPNDYLTDDDDTNNTTTKEVEVSISNNIGYWYSTNECPGLGHSQTDWSNGSVISGSGIDLGEFTMGSVLGDTTYYVVFSNLTKVVSDYTFGEGETKNYVFTIYRRTVDTTDGDNWTAFDTISITANGTTTKTNFTTDATKYNVENIAKYEYKIVETGYSIGGYSCSNVIEVMDSNGDYQTSSDGVFTFATSTSSDGKTVTYNAVIKCTNTYTEAGLTISKVVENAPASAADDEFTVKIWPKELSATGVELGENETMATYFNGGTYKIGDTVLTVTVDDSATYGYIAITIKGGESKTITGLPAGTYYVQEVDGTNTNANWTYDTTEYTADLTSGSATVTVTNTYKYADLTITKSGWNSTDENQSYIFTVTGPNGFEMDVVINGNGSVTIKNLLIGEYTVTEKTDWSWRYTPTDNSKTITLVANGNNTVTFENKRSWIYWLSGDNYNENQFTVKSKDDED